MMRTADFDFELPPELIAQQPAPERDQSRLLVLHRNSGRIEHRRFRDLLGYLRPGDLVVLNNSRVIPARLRGFNPTTGGEFELLLLEENAVNDWWVMLRPGKRGRLGTRIRIQGPKGHAVPAEATVIEINAEGHRRVRFTGVDDLRQHVQDWGEIPLPPYITRPADATVDGRRYQTVFAEPAGSVAAPTAGLHFTAALLEEIRGAGARTCCLTLHVGLGTFAPVKTEVIASHTMHEERYELSEAAASAIQATQQAGGRIVAVGTTTVRVLESVAARHQGRVVADQGRTRIFIHPPYEFRIVDALLTNFHLPRSTLLMLASAFAAPKATSGRELVLAAYREAIRERYRFFSYGDAMLLL